MKIQLILAALLLCGTAHAGRLAELYQQTKNPVVAVSQLAEAKAHGITEIGLERSPCFGFCPDYTVIITSEGKVTYDGGNFAPRKGHFTGKVDSWQFNELARYINEADFAKFADSYTLGITDSATVYTSVVQNGKRKIVSNYARSGPANLWAIEKLIDELVTHTKWDSPAK